VAVRLCLHSLIPPPLTYKRRLPLLAFELTSTNFRRISCAGRRIMWATPW
jgi:hypothetical protein